MKRRFMKKTFLTAALSLAFITSSLSASAQPLSTVQTKEEFKLDACSVELLQTNPERIFETYSNVIDVQEITLDDSQGGEAVKAFQYNPDGTVQELDCEITLNKVTCRDDSRSVFSEGEGTSTFYVMSASTLSTSKVSDDSIEEDGVKLVGNIGWIDNLGPYNELEYISGSRSGSYAEDEKGTYSLQRQSHEICSGKYNSSFYDASKAGTHAARFDLHVYSYSSSGYSVHLHVQTSISD